MPLFEVSNEVELLALWRLVAEAKFQADPDDADLWGSPIVHRLANDIAIAMLKNYEAKGDLEAAARHKAWIASLPTNVVLPVVKTNLRRDASEPLWKSWSHAEKVAYVKGCIAPFTAEPPFLDHLIGEAEA